VVLVRNIYLGGVEVGRYEGGMYPVKARKLASIWIGRACRNDSAPRSFSSIGVCSVVKPDLEYLR
jgi:hypothetical protein